MGSCNLLEHEGGVAPRPRHAEAAGLFDICVLVLETVCGRAPRGMCECCLLRGRLIKGERALGCWKRMDQGRGGLQRVVGCLCMVC